MSAPDAPGTGSSGPATGADAPGAGLPVTDAPGTGSSGSAPGAVAPGADVPGASPVPGEVFASASDLVLGYGSTIAVTASTFEIPHRQVTAIIGPNGSGKSTLLNALAGVAAPRAGQLTVLGQQPRDSWRRVAYVLQSLAFPEGTPITVREVVAMGLYPKLGWFRRPSGEDRERVQRAMERLSVTDLARRHLGELSGGQRQRVYVAQGLAQRHEALLLDEPLTGLDLVSARVIDQIIHSERERGHAVVLTTHDLDEARAADWVILMSGRVVAAGPPAEVLTRANLVEAYGLGSLHGGDGAFFDDPHAEFGDSAHEHSRHAHPHPDPHVHAHPTD